MTDQRLARQIRNGRIDILIDLSLHTAGNRLLTFARKPAPVQISYLGYCGSSGVPTIDYWIGDDAVARDATAYAGERALSLGESFCCYRPPNDAPEPGDPPIQSNQFVTFGSFNTLAKITDDTIKAWAEIMRRLPEAHLVIHAKGAGEPSVARRLKEMLDRDRVQLIGQQPFERHLQIVRGVDIALDTFPFNGHTTTCHALWMGVPIVSRSGRVPTSRAGASLLRNVGLPDLTTDSYADYIERAIALAHDCDRLGAIRHPIIAAREDAILRTDERNNRYPRARTDVPARMEFVVRVVVRRYLRRLRCHR
jgi:protein O-GlcNAc transferase